ncbi:hypothetical protein A0O36_00821 [Piscirickettsiaceae bacterium NZ-RLO1]|nr:hypothetical protein A0O36_00821 [Piscirickettsiaceae bacterium NZ-RLO1]
MLNTNEKTIKHKVGLIKCVTELYRAHINYYTPDEHELITETESINTRFSG